MWYCTSNKKALEVFGGNLQETLVLSADKFEKADGVWYTYAWFGGKERKL